MFDWLVDIVIFVTVAGFAAYLVYSVFFSGSDLSRSEVRKQTMYRGFERRSVEQLDRRKKDIGPPPGISERRRGPRRSTD